MKKSFLTFIWTVLALGLWAESVTPDMAKTAADAWVLKNSPFGAKGQASSVLTVCDTNAAQTVLWHQVSMSNGGMLVVAPVTEIEPVLVALEKDPGALPENHVLRSILQMDIRRRLRLLGLYAEDSQGASLASVTPPRASEETAAVDAWGTAQKKKWARLGVGTAAALQEAVTAGISDITVQIGIVDGFEQGGRFTHWNQAASGGGYCYNYYTPNHAVCGCVATACSALVQAFGATNSVEGISAKGCSYNNESYFEAVDAGKIRAPGGSKATLGGAIDWSILPSNYGGTNEVSEKLGDEQRQLLGRIAFDAGVGVGMGWTDSESGAVEANIAVALREVFGFKNARALGCSGTEEEFSKLIWNQCWCGRPVGLGISAEGSPGGHSVLAVGYGKDADGVDRVRIFCGWGGAGDGWYALPYIQTHGTLNGATVNYNIVNDVVTMISYEDDNIVPVVGQVSLGGVPIEVPGMGTSVMADENGYFHVLVPPSLTDCRLICCGKEATFEIGEKAADSSSTSDLLPALPDTIDWPLLNASVAFSFEKAKELALEQGKAILRISGVSSQSNTQAIVDYIYGLDEVNGNDFTNRFVYFYSSATSSDPTRGDGSPSYGVFLPETAETDGRWLFNNGRLTYGFALTSAQDIEEDDEAGLVKVVGSETNTLVFTAIKGQESTKVVFNNGVEDEVRAAVLESLQQVMDQGWELYLRATSNIKLTVASSGAEAGAPEPMYGVHTDYTNGEVVVATSYAEITNEANTIVFGCSGWTLTNETTGVFLKGTGNTAKFAVASNDVCTLTWQMDKTNAVYIAVTPSDDGCATISPESGWYPYGETVVFTVAPATGWTLSNWLADGEDLDLTGAVAKGTALAVPATEPGTYIAMLRHGSASSEVITETNTLTVISLAMNDEGVFVPMTEAGIPQTVVFGLPESESVKIDSLSEMIELPATELGVCIEKTSFTTASGRKLNLYGVSTDGTTATLSSVLDVNLSKGDMTVMWLWEIVEEGEEDLPEEFVIDWNESLDNLTESFSTNLLTAAQFASSGLTLEQLAEKVKTPTGWKANLAEDAEGNVVATLVVDEEVLKPVATEGSSLLTIASNADGTLTVQANIGNGVKGFIYTLYVTDDLAGAWSAVATGDYDTGSPSEQAKADAPLTLEIGLTPDDTKKFYKVVVSAKKD